MPRRGVSRWEEGRRGNSNRWPREGLSVQAWAARPPCCPSHVPCFSRGSERGAPQGGALSQPNNNSQPGPSGQLFLEPLTQLPCDSARPQAGMRKSQGGPWPGRSRQPGGRGQWGPRSRPGWQRSPPASGLLGASGPGLRTAPPPPPPTYCSLLHRQLLPLKLSMENLMSEFQCWQRMWLTFTSWGAMRPKGLGLDPPQVSLSTLGP